jgi:S-adenosylmethionine hydrolase
MTPEDYVLENEKIIQAIRDRTPGDERLDMYYGTLDYATARFHTILLRLSQNRIMEQEHEVEVMECFEAIQAFYSNVKRYEAWPKFFRHIVAIVLHGIGTRRIPKIKRLLNQVNN